MTNFRALVPGGYFSSTPNDKSNPVAIRYNNFGAINGDPIWVQEYPGYAGLNETTPGNKTAIFEAPEYGVGLWWTLMKKYQDGGNKTLRQIILHYGGEAQTAIYEGYARDVAARTGIPLNQVIDLNDDKQLLKFARAMAQQEAGKPSPLSDAQILYGFQFARQLASTGKAPPPPRAQPTAPANESWLTKLLALIFQPHGQPKLTFTHVLVVGEGIPDPSNEVRLLQRRMNELGYTDLNPDGQFGEVTENAVKNFQTSHRLDPNGEVDQLTIEELNNAKSGVTKPPLNPPSTAKYGTPPPWYQKAEKDIGFHEKGTNQGIEPFIDDAKAGSRQVLLGQPWCAVAVNAWLERCGIMGSRSAMARSFESNPNFIKLNGPALGAITTMWRVSEKSGQGHVFLYDGENARGIRGISGNDNDQVQRSFQDRRRVVNYYWPRAYPLPKIGSITVNDAGAVVSGSQV